MIAIYSWATVKMNNIYKAQYLAWSGFHRYCVCAYAKSLQSCPTLCDPRAHQAPLPMGFSRQEYGGGLPCPPPGDLPDPDIEPVSLRQEDSLPLAPPGSPVALERMPPTDGLLAGFVCLSPTLAGPMRGSVVTHVVENMEDEGLNF